MFRDRPTPTTGPQLRDAAAEELSDAATHLGHATNYVLALSALAPEMSPARHDRERLASQIERLQNQTRNRRTTIQYGA